MSVYEALELMINFGILLLAILTFNRKKQTVKPHFQL